MRVNIEGPTSGQSKAGAPEKSDNPYEAVPFRHVAEMEQPLTTASDVLKGVAMIAETMGEDEGSVVQRLAWLALEQIKAAERLRCDLFRLTHPHREDFEKQGWPTGDQPPAAVSVRPT